MSHDVSLLGLDTEFVVLTVQLITHCGPHWLVPVLARC